MFLLKYYCIKIYNLIVSISKKIIIPFFIISYLLYNISLLVELNIVDDLCFILAFVLYLYSILKEKTNLTLQKIFDILIVLFGFSIICLATYYTILHNINNGINWLFITGLILIGYFVVLNNKEVNHFVKSYLNKGKDFNDLHESVENASKSLKIKGDSDAGIIKDVKKKIDNTNEEGILDKKEKFDTYQKKLTASIKRLTFAMRDFSSGTSFLVRLIRRDPVAGAKKITKKLENLNSSIESEKKQLKNSYINIINYLQALKNIDGYFPKEFWDFKDSAFYGYNSLKTFLETITKFSVEYNDLKDVKNKTQTSMREIVGDIKNFCDNLESILPHKE